MMMVIVRLLLAKIIGRWAGKLSMSPDPSYLHPIPLRRLVPKKRPMLRSRR